MQRTSLRTPGAQTISRALSGATAAIVVLCSSIAATAGLAWRFPAYLRKSDTAVIYQVNNSFGRSNFNSTAAARVLVIGDSHQADVFNALNLNADLLPSIDVRSQRFDDDCLWMTADSPDQPASFEPSLLEPCRAERSAFASSDHVADADVIVVSTRWSQTGLDGLPALATWLVKDTQAQLIVLGRTAEFPDVPLLLAKSRRAHQNGCWPHRNRQRLARSTRSWPRKPRGWGYPSSRKMHGSAPPRLSAMPSMNKAG